MARPHIEKLNEIIAADLMDAVHKWDIYLRAERNLSKHTLRAYHADLQHFVQFLTQHLGKAPSIDDLSEVKIQDFRGWLAKKAKEGTSNRSRARSLSGVKNFLTFLDKNGIMHNAAVSLIRSPKLPRTLPKALSEKQSKKLVSMNDLPSSSDWVTLRDRALFTLLYGCGLRIAEALNLNLGDIPTDGFWRIMGKGQKERLVPTLPAVTKAIDTYVEACPYAQERDRPLFIGVQGKRLNQGMAQKAMRALRRALRLPETATPHALRHSYATHLLAEGANLREIQELLGHASLSTTQIYADVDTTKIMEIHKKAHPRNQKD